jgi:hypothetical protein
MAEQNTIITEKEKKTMTEIATKKARDLGYKPEELNFTLTKEANLFKAQFYPQQKQGMVTYGGTLEIYLDEKGNVIRIKRGI